MQHNEANDKQKRAMPGKRQCFGMFQTRRCSYTTLAQNMFVRDKILHVSYAINGN